MSLRKTLLAAAIVATGLATGPLPARAAGGELYLYNWSNYIPTDLLERFGKETGIKVTLDVYDSNETLLAKLQAGGGNYDVIVPSDYMVDTMIKENMLEKIDAASMSNFKNVQGPLQKPWFDAARTYTAPYMYGTTGFTYDSARVPGGKVDATWKSYFEPPSQLKGQMVSLNDEIEVYKAASLYLGVDACTEDGKVAEKIYNLLTAQKPFLTMYQSDGTIERMAAGEVILHMQWNGAAHRAKEQRNTLVYVYPKEGINFWADNLAVPKSAKNKENAKIFINWMMDPKNIAEASNFTGYMSAVPSSVQYLDAALKNDPAVVPPPGTEALFRPNKTCSEKARDLRNKVWTKLRS